MIHACFEVLRWSDNSVLRKGLSLRLKGVETQEEE